MKKLFFIFVFLIIFCGHVFAVEQADILKQYKLAIKKEINLDMQGNVDVYLGFRADKSLCSYRILSYNNKELAEIIDKSFLKIEKRPDVSGPFLMSTVRFSVCNKNIEAEILSKSYSQTNEEMKYNKTITGKLNKNMQDIPHYDIIDLNNVVLEFNISSLGKVNKIKLLQSSGDDEYDKKLCNYLLNQTFEMPPNNLLKNGNYAYIIKINPTSDSVLEDFKEYYKEISKEIEKQISFYNGEKVSLYFEINKDGSVHDVKLYKDNKLIDSDKIVSKLRKIKVQPYNGNLKGNYLSFYYANHNSRRIITNYFVKDMMPILQKTIPEFNTFALKPVRVLIMMNKNGLIEEAILTGSSGSAQIDNDCINAINLASFPEFKNFPTDRFVFEVELYNLNKYLSQYYTKYAKTVTSYTFGNIPSGNLRTAKIYFEISQDGKIKTYKLFDYVGNEIKEKRVEENLKRLTFPKFPQNIDAEELGVLVDLHNPESNTFTNFIYSSMWLAGAILNITAHYGL